jgi:HSP20 family protein
MPSRQLAPLSGRSGFGLDPVLDLHREMNRLFDDVFRGGTLADVRSGFQAPRVDVHEKDGELWVEADLPGITKDDLDIQLNGDMLTISGKKEEEHKEERRNYYMMERSSGQFQRTIQLPCSPQPDQVKASFENGVLQIRMPSEGKSAHRISLEGAGQQAGQKQTEPAAAGSKPQKH